MRGVLSWARPHALRSLGSRASRHVHQRAPGRPLRALRTLAESLPPELLQEEGPEYDGLDDLEIDDDGDEAAAAAFELADDDVPGSGLQELERLWKQYTDGGQDTELEDSEIEALHARLRRDVPRCPLASTVAWVTHALERLGLEDDETFETLETVLVERADELSSEGAVQAVTSFGNIYWAGPDKDRRLLFALAAAVRKQLNDFTLSELAQLANAMMRMGATDDTKLAGLFYEMSKRVNLPDAEEYIKDAANRDGSVYRGTDPKVKGLIDSFAKRLPKEKQKLPPEVEHAIAWEYERAIEKAEREKMAGADHPGWEDVMEDWKTIKKEESAGDPAEVPERPAPAPSGADMLDPSIWRNY